MTSDRKGRLRRTTALLVLVAAPWLIINIDRVVEFWWIRDVGWSFVGSLLTLVTTACTAIWALVGFATVLFRRRWATASAAIAITTALAFGTLAPNWGPLLSRLYYDTHMSQLDKARATQSSDAGPIVVLHDRLLLEGGAGYAWLASPTSTSDLVVNDDPGHVCWPVGNGWYWVESGPAGSC